MKGENERLLSEILNDAYPREWEQDVTFLEYRKYRGDAVNRKRKIVIEIDGGTHPFWMTTKEGKKIKATTGGHSSPDGIQRDMEKSNEAQVAGWKYLRYTPQTLRKTPHKIILDVRLLCGDSPANEQTKDMCFDNVKTKFNKHVDLTMYEDTKAIRAVEASADIKQMRLI
jgi:very-short-patch-repair endonuclease